MKIPDLILRYNNRILEGGGPARKITLCVSSLIERRALCLALLMAESLVLTLPLENSWSRSDGRVKDKGLVAVFSKG